MFEEHKKYTEPKRLVAAISILLCVSALLVITPTARGAQFYIAEWDRDSYGQGIHAWYAQSNRTGSWVSYASYNYLQTYGAVDWNVSQAIRIGVWSCVNYTFLGLADTEANLILAVNYIKHNVTVTDQFGDTVYSKQNFTTMDYNESYDGFFWYRHLQILDFSPQEGEYYTVTLIAEVYW